MSFSLLRGITNVIALAILASASVSAQQGPPLMGDWVISDLEQFQNMSVTLNGNLIVQPSGTLFLNNVRITFAQPLTGIYQITVKPGGSLFISGGTIAPAKAGGTFAFAVQGNQCSQPPCFGIAQTHIVGLANGGWVVQGTQAIIDGNTIDEYTADAGLHLANARLANVVNNTFTCADTQGKVVDPCAQITLSDSNSNTIASNHLINAYQGVVLTRSFNNNVSSNTITLPHDAHGIDIQQGSGYNVITQNIYTVIDPQINCTAFRIDGTQLPNYVTSNSFIGLRQAAYIIQSANAMISGNTWRKRSDSRLSGGMEIYSSANIDIMNNDMDVYSGIAITQSNNVRVRGNNIRNGDWGVQILGSASNVIESNTFAGNKDDMVVLSSNNNVIDKNNFTTSERHAYDDSTNNWNNNFWSDYDGSAPIYAIAGGAIDTAPTMSPYTSQTVPVPQRLNNELQITPQMDTQITTDTTWSNCAMQFSGFVYVNSGATLNIQNCNISYSSSADTMGMKIVALPGSHLNISGSTFGAAGNPNADVGIIQQAGASVNIHMSQFLYGDYYPVIELDGTGAIVDQVTINNCNQAFAITGSGAKVTNSKMVDCAVGVYDSGATGLVFQGNSISGAVRTAQSSYNGAGLQFVNNTVDNAMCGLFLFQSQQAVVHGNEFRNNRLGVESDAGGGNLFYQNDFIENGLQAYGDDWTGSSAFAVCSTRGQSYGATAAGQTDQWSNQGQGNFWSDYRGVDADGNGVGDTPYATGELMNPGPNNPFVPLLDPDPLISPFGAGTCGYSVEPGTINVSGVATSGALTIRTGNNCAWTATTKSDWLMLPQGSSGKGPAILTFQTPSNPGTGYRKGSIAIAGETISVIQAPGGCSYSVTPAFAAPGKSSIQQSASVTTAAGCPWTASANETWLHIQSGKKGIASGNVVFLVDANPLAFARAGTLAIAGQTVIVNQSVGPALFGGGVVNAASGTASGVVPGGFMTIYGDGLGSDPGVALSSLTLGYGATHVFFDATEAYLTYVSQHQVNLVVPNGLTPGATTQVVALVNGAASGPLPMQVVAADPGIFTIDGSGQGEAVVVNQDGTLNSTANPAPRGSTIAFYATGIGATSPTLIDGVQPDPSSFPKPTLPLSVLIGGTAVPASNILFDGLVYAGVAQVNVTIPDAAPTGDQVPLALSIQCQPNKACASRPGVTVAIK